MQKLQNSFVNRQQNGTEPFCKVSFQFSGMAAVLQVEGLLPQFSYNGEEQLLTFSLNELIFKFQEAAMTPVSFPFRESKQKPLINSNFNLLLCRAAFPPCVDFLIISSAGSKTPMNFLSKASPPPCCSLTQRMSQIMRAADSTYQSPLAPVLIMRQESPGPGPG